MYQEFIRLKILAGIGSFAFMIVIVLTSLWFMRSKCYEVFMKIHYICFVVILVLGMLHKGGYVPHTQAHAPPSSPNTDLTWH